MIHLKLISLLVILLPSFTWSQCYSWKAPTELTQGYEERLEWELRAFDLIDWEKQPCKHFLKIELKPIVSRWYVQYQFDSLPELRSKYETLDDFNKGLPKDLKKLMGAYQTEEFKSMSAKYSSNKWKLLKPDAWPLFEVGITSEYRNLGGRSQNLSGLEFAITRSLSHWMYEVNLGGAYQGHNPNSDGVWVDWKNHVGVEVEYSFFEEALNSPTLNSGLSIQGLYIRTPNKWRGGGMDMFPEWNVGAGFRGFRAHAFNLGIITKLHLPLGTVQVYDVDQASLKEYYPMGFSMQLQAGF